MKSTVVNLLPSVHTLLSPFSVPVASSSRGNNNKGSSDNNNNGTLLDNYSPQVLLQALCVRLESRGKPLEQQLLKVFQANPQLQLEIESKTASLSSSPNPSPKQTFLPDVVASSTINIPTGSSSTTSRQLPVSLPSSSIDASASFLDVPPPPPYIRSSNRPVSVSLRKSPAMETSVGGGLQSKTNQQPSTWENSVLKSSPRSQYKSEISPPLSTLVAKNNGHEDNNDDDDDDEEVHL